ncbi:MAG: DUF4307 domain-containing protein [Jiangellaceae bacterium]
MTTPVARPADRYGDRSPGWLRWVWLTIAGVLVVAAMGWWILQETNDAVRGRLIGWEDPAGGVMTVTLEVVRSPELAVACDLVAVDLRRVVVGQTSVQIPPGDDRRVQVQAEIALEADAVAPQLRGCVVDDG